MAASDDILSQDEIDALLHGVDNGEVDTTGAGEGAADEVRSYDFGSQDRVVKGRLPGLETINERFARQLKTALYDMLRATADVSAEAVEQLRFGDYASGLPVPVSLNRFAMQPLHGNGLIVLDARLVYVIVDSFFGGSGQIAGKIEGREFTVTEQRVIRNLVERCFAELGKAWSPIVEVGFEYLGHAANPDMTSIAAPGESLVVSRFSVDFEGGGGELQLVFPYAMLEPLRQALDSGVQSERGETDERWRSYLHDELMHAPVEVGGTLLETQISVADLLNLKPGDVVPVELPGRVTLAIEEIPVLRGRYGVFNEHAAVQVEEIVTLATSTALVPDRPDRQR